MDLRLTRTEFLKDGIFSKLEDIGESVLFYCLEHAYPLVPNTGSIETTYAPKIPPGTYKCVLSEHQLEGMTYPFLTYEITGVEGHTGLLFHSGNLNKDSIGCVLVGMAREDVIITQSKMAFEKFMEIQNGIPEFTLLVQ